MIVKMIIENYVLVEYIDTRESVKVPDGIVKIGKNAFKDCNFLKKVKLPESVKEICESAFENCESLESINFPNRLTKIEKKAFAACKSLKSIEFSKNLQEIEEGAFYCCKSLENIKNSEKIEIGYKAFGLCKIDNLKHHNFFIKDGIAYSYKKEVLYLANESLKEPKISEEAEIINPFAFFNTRFENIKLPKSIKVISKGAFARCINLKNIEFSENLIEIGSEAFKYCKSLENVKLPNSVKYLGANAFDSCESLKIVELSEKIEKIEKNCFKFAPVETFKNLKDEFFIVENGLVLSSDKKTLLYPTKNKFKTLIIPESVTTIEEIELDGIGIPAYLECDYLVISSNVTNIISKLKIIPKKAYLFKGSKEEFNMNRILKEHIHSMNFNFDFKNLFFDKDFDFNCNVEIELEKKLKIREIQKVSICAFIKGLFEDNNIEVEIKETDKYFFDFTVSILIDSIKYQFVIDGEKTERMFSELNKKRFSTIEEINEIFSPYLSKQ